LKKEAKTFATPPSQAAVPLLQLGRNQTDKSFLVPFFKKNALP
jgi:hypothetical protein